MASAPSAAPSAAPPGAGPRLHHLDALRSFAILYGLMVHTATLGVAWPLTLISDVSGYFRMGTFFLVSGFFAAMVLRRYGPGLFLQKRAVALLVPLVCGVCLLNPLTNWLIWNWHNPPLSLPDYLQRAAQGSLPPGKGPMVWSLHLWFLMSLSFYALTAPLVMAGARAMPGLSAGLGNRLAALPGWLCVMGVAGGIALAALVLRAGYEVALDGFLQRTVGGTIAWVVRNTLYYWPMFLTGMAVFHHAGFSARFQTVSLPALAIGLAAVVLIREGLPPGGLLWEVAQLVSRAFLTTAVIAALMAVFRRWFSQPGFLSRRAEAVYSIYILHFLVIYLIAHALRPLGLPTEVLFVAVVAGTFGIVMLLHRHVIAPSPVLSLMFNGKPLPAQKPAA